MPGNTGLVFSPFFPLTYRFNLLVRIEQKHRMSPLFKWRHCPTCSRATQSVQTLPENFQSNSHSMCIRVSLWSTTMCTQPSFSFFLYFQYNIKISVGPSLPFLFGQKPVLSPQWRVEHINIRAANTIPCPTVEFPSQDTGTWVYIKHILLASSQGLNSKAIANSSATVSSEFILLLAWPQLRPPW